MPAVRSKFAFEASCEDSFRREVRGLVRASCHYYVLHCRHEVLTYLVQLLQLLVMLAPKLRPLRELVLAARSL